MNPEETIEFIPTIDSLFSRGFPSLFSQGGFLTVLIFRGIIHTQFLIGVNSSVDFSRFFYLTSLALHDNIISLT